MTHDIPRSPALLVALALLAGCGADPGTLFSSSGVSTGGVSSAGRSAVAGSGGADVAAGSDNGGASLTGGGGQIESSGAGGAAGAAAAGAAQGGSESAGAPSAGMAGVAGGAGSAGAGGAPSPSACDGKTVIAAPLIADFEAGVAGWSGYLGSDPFGVQISQPGADSTEHALRFSGGNAKTSGVFQLLPCSDVSEFEGIQFWAKGKPSNNVRFLAVIPATDPTPGIGDCHEPEMKCSDHPGKVFTFGNNWQLYQASWAELKQYGWGTKASFASVLNAVLWINDGPVESFDFSIDQISLYKNASR